MEIKLAHKDLRKMVVGTKTSKRLLNIAIPPLVNEG